MHRPSNEWLAAALVAVLLAMLAMANTARAQEQPKPESQTVHDGASAPASSAATWTVWPAPVGHRQPRLKDMPAAARERIRDAERAQMPYRGLLICRGC
jgi:hypothetical protein